MPPQLWELFIVFTPIDGSESVARIPEFDTDDNDDNISSAASHQVPRPTFGQRFLPALPELPSLPSLPSLPAMPSMPSLPKSLPSLPSLPTSFPSIPKSFTTVPSVIPGFIDDSEPNVTPFQASLAMVSNISVMNGRHGHRAVSVDNGQHIDMGLRGDVFVFGGQDGDEFLGDLVVLDMMGCVTSMTPASASSPPPRAFHSFHLFNNALFVYGGFCTPPSTAETPSGTPLLVLPEVRNDFWRLPLSTHAWEEVRFHDIVAQSGLDTARSHHLSVVWEGMMWVFGGYNSTWTLTNSILRYNISRSGFTLSTIYIMYYFDKWFLFWFYFDILNASSS
jgi:hypothetical protein